MGEGLRLDSARVMAVRRAAARHGSDPAAARLAARAIAAGLDPESPELDSVLGVLDAPGGHRGGSDGSGSSDPRAGDDSSHRLAPDAEAVVAGLGAALMKAVRLSSSDPRLVPMSIPDANGSGWACAPFELEYGGTEFRGFIRIWYYSNGVSRVIGRMAADIRCGWQRRLVELIGPSSAPTIAYYADDDRERRAFEREFSRRGNVRTDSLERGYGDELASENGAAADA